MLAYGVVLAVAALSTYLLTFAVRRGAIRVGAVVLPDERRGHEAPPPPPGGRALFAGFPLALGGGSPAGPVRPRFDGASQPPGVGRGAGGVFAVGLAGDLHRG